MGLFALLYDDWIGLAEGRGSFLDVWRQIKQGSGTTNRAGACSIRGERMKRGLSQFAGFAGMVLAALTAGAAAPHDARGNVAGPTVTPSAVAETEQVPHG